MEEKLYFKPASYGKGIKQKEKPLRKKEKADGEKTHRVRNLVLFLLFIVIVVIVIIWLLHGKTTTRGQYPENIRNESLECSAPIDYNKITSISSDDKNIKLNLVFMGAEKLNTISLQYGLKFNNKSEAISAEAKAHAEFNLGLAAAGYNSESFENKFTILDNKLVVSIHASRLEIDDSSKKYFIIYSGEIPTTLNEYKSYYESVGFICTTSLNNL